MLEAQKMMLNRSGVAPTGVTPEEWLGNATNMAIGLTAYNEVIIAPTDESAAGSIFWAHPGPFRKPLPSEYGARQIAAFLKAGANTLPIFELAGVNLDRPFHDCWKTNGTHLQGQGIDPKPGCLSQGIAEWNSNLTAGGGKRDASSIFRELTAATFLEMDRNEALVFADLVV